MVKSRRYTAPRRCRSLGKSARTGGARRTRRGSRVARRPDAPRLENRRWPVRQADPCSAYRAVDEVDSPQRTQRCTEKNHFSIGYPGFTRRHLGSVGMERRIFSVSLCVLCVLCGDSTWSTRAICRTGIRLRTRPLSIRQPPRERLQPLVNL